jgi:hypothetical protein
MDPAELAHRAVAHLPDYLGKVEEGIAGQIGADLDRALISSLQRFYRWLKGAVSGDQEAQEALTRFEQEPDDQRRQSSLEQALVRLIEAAPSSAAPLVEDFVNAAERAETTINRTENATIAISGRTVDQRRAVIIGTIGRNTEDERD